MKTAELLEELKGHGLYVFSIYDAAKLMQKSIAYASLFLSKSKEFVRIEKGKYAIKDTDPFIVASNILYPSYLSLASAMRFYDLIDQNIVKYSVISVKRHASILFSGSIIEFKHIKRERFFGYAKKDNVYVAEVEKLFIDCIYFGAPDFAMVLEALKYAIDSKSIDLKRMQEYIIAFNSKSLVNKMGFLLGLAGVEANEIFGKGRKGYVRISGLGKSGIDKKWMVKYD